MKRQGNGPAGLIVVDKPAGMTSHQVVSQLRRLAGTRRVGHAGTLDPMATGVLVIGVERATRMLGHLTLTEKTYQATIRLGQATVTDDAEGEVVSTQPAGELRQADVEAEMARLTGAIQQVPSKVSAVRVNGQRSYKRVRAGEDVELTARPVTVSTFQLRALRAVRLPDPDPDPAPASQAHVCDLDVTVECSSGTYVRALARDLGAALGVGGHLTALRRTRVGPYRVEQARTLDELADSLDVLPLGTAAAAAFPRRDVDADDARRLIHGIRLSAAGYGTGPIAVFGPEDRFLALVEEKDGQARSLAVFAQDHG